MDELHLRWWLAAVSGGACCGLAGFFLMGLQVPFLAVCLAHSAMAGAVAGLLLGWSPSVCGFVAALAAASILGPLADRSRVSREAMAGILFSLSLGLAFLGIGVLSARKAEALGLIWGSLLLLRWADVLALCLVLAAGIALTLRWYAPLRAVLFDRGIARMSGLPAGLFLYAILVWCGLTVAVSLEAIGGLMLYSLLINPAASARQLSERYASTLALSVALGVLCAAGGLALSIGFDWPAGSSIVVLSALVFALSTVAKLMRSSF